MNAAVARCSPRFPAPRVAHPAFLIDRGYRLEMSLTPRNINTNAISNRR